MLELKLDDIRYFNSYQQGLYPTEEYPAIISVARNLVGLHSARLTTPYVTLFSRNKNFIHHSLREELFENKQLIKMRCMRKTLHIVPLDLAPIVHQATLKLRTQDWVRLSKQVESQTKQIDRIREIIIEQIKEKPKSSKAIIEIISQKEPPSYCTTILPFIIKQLWEEGVICYINASKDWLHEDRVYGYTSSFYSDLNLSKYEQSEAENLLIRKYIHSYGPVAPEDISWWTGLGIGKVHKHLKEIQNHIIEVKIRGIEKAFYMTHVSLDHYFSIEKLPCKKWVKLLAYEDPYLKGYFYSRWRYIDQPYMSRLFNTIGEARSSIMIDGKVIGIWGFDKKSKEIIWESFIKLTGEDLYLLSVAIDEQQQWLNVNN